MIRSVSGLGTRLRTVLSMLDGDVEALYIRFGTGFRPRFYPIVMHLIEHDTATISELAVAAGVTQPAATQTISEMEKLGFVNVSAAADRRARAVVLSREGQEIARQLAPMWSAIDLAARQLDAELPYPLSTVLDEAIAALHEERFIDRIDKNIQGD